MDFESEYTEEGLERVQEIVEPISGDKLEIVIPEHHKGKYLLPKPASSMIPDWYKSLEVSPNPKAPLDKSVRACMPFMESLTFGWIIPVPVDIACTRNDDGSLHMEWDDETYQVMGSHSKLQVNTDKFPHDGELIKFNIPYQLRTPDGVSTRHMPPLNRIETRFRPFSGIVETDRYMDSVNFPALVLDQEWEGVIQAGTPLVQIIPFERDRIVNESKTRLITEEEQEWRDITNGAVGSKPSFYKEEVWEPKEASREVGKCPFGFGSDDG